MSEPSPACLETGGSSAKTDCQDTKSVALRVASIFITAQYFLLCSSLYIIGSTIYILSATTNTDDVLISNVMMIFSAWVSINYVACHIAASHVHFKVQSETTSLVALRLQRCTSFFLRCSVFLWFITCGMSITFTMARHPSCEPTSDPTSGSIIEGRMCVLQRCSVAAGLLACSLSLLLFVMVSKMREPFRYHLFGIRTKRTSSNSTLFYNESTRAATFSEMSFKCLSSTSISSRTLVPSFGSSATNVQPRVPERAGLGIYTSKAKLPSLLTPRPSLSSIIGFASMTPIPPPPCSPLPKLSPYFPQQPYRNGSARYTTLNSTCPSLRSTHPQYEGTLRIVAPSPALSAANLAVLNHSQESLSSIYSRSTSGKRCMSHNDSRTGVLGIESSRTFSSDSTATVKESPLTVMRLARAPNLAMGSTTGCRSMSDGTPLLAASSGINDAAALLLQDRLSTVKSVSEPGEFEDPTCSSSLAAARYYQDLLQPGKEAGKSESNSRPLMVGKTRGKTSCVVVR